MVGLEPYRAASQSSLALKRSRLAGPAKKSAILVAVPPREMWCKGLFAQRCPGLSFISRKCSRRSVEQVGAASFSVGRFGRRFVRPTARCAEGEHGEK